MLYKKQMMLPNGQEPSRIDGSLQIEYQFGNDHSSFLNTDGREPNFEQDDAAEYSFNRGAFDAKQDAMEPAIPVFNTD